MRQFKSDSVRLAPVDNPDFGLPQEFPPLPDSLYPARLAALRKKMADGGIDALIVYADREHFSNFRYLAGFEPRFEEGLLVVSRKDPSPVLLGNECYPMHSTAKIPVTGMLCQALSLPNQPMDEFASMQDSLKRAGIGKGMKIGVAGWKLFTPAHGENWKRLFCVPSFIVDAIADIAGRDAIVNATGLFIDPADGLRIVNEPEQIAAFEYGSTLASQGLLNLLARAEPGMSEFDLCDNLVSHGLPLPCHTLVSAGPNTKRGLVSPTQYRTRRGDPLTASFALEGGLSCRGGYIASDASELPDGTKDFLEVAVKPYYAAVAAWYETIGVGVGGEELFNIVQTLLPKEKYGWVLNPGHLIGTEEWLSSPNYPGSKCAIKSGMIMQMDIIPSGPYVSPNVEDGVAIADASLRNKLKSVYPAMWKRMQARRDFMSGKLGINLKEDVLPMSNLAGLYRPFVLDRKKALIVDRG